MFFLLKSDKWAPYRDYWYEVRGTKTTTFLFGFLTVLVMPILLWIMRRGENGIQFLFGARTLADSKSNHVLESVIVIPQQSQIPSHPKEIKQKLKVLFGLVLSKTYVFVVFGLIYGLLQMKSDGFRCRNLKNAAGFLLSNDTQPADYLNADFRQIWEMRKENAKDENWLSDHVNGLLSDYLNDYEYYYDHADYFYYSYDAYDAEKMDFSQNFSQTTDLIETFNLRGYHEVCNTMESMDFIEYTLLPPWFDSRNAAGMFY